MDAGAGPMVYYHQAATGVATTKGDMMRRAIIAALLGAILAGGCALPAPAPGPAPSTICTEDMPCWDCETMGDKVCGPAYRGIPPEAHDRWRECYVEWHQNPGGVTATEAATECDAEALASL